MNNKKLDDLIDNDGPLNVFTLSIVGGALSIALIILMILWVNYIINLFN